MIRDWYSGGRVDHVYPLPCYRAAIRALPDDVLQYSDASAVIERALETARHRGAPAASRTTDEAPVTARTPAPAAEPSRPHPSRPSPERRRASPAPIATRRTAPSVRLAAEPVERASTPELPYPLIALGALSAVLLVSGVAAGLAHRRR